MPTKSAKRARWELYHNRIENATLRHIRRELAFTQEELDRLLLQIERTGMDLPNTFWISYQRRVAEGIKGIYRRIIEMLKDATEPREWESLGAGEILQATARFYAEQEEPVSLIDDALEALILQRANVIAEIVTGTVRKDVSAKVAKTLREGLEQGLSEREIGKLLEARLGTLLTTDGISLGARAQRIARTEITAVVNGANFEVDRKEFPNQKKEWLTVGDDLVRDSHRDNQREGAIPMTQAFSNGSQFPGDSSDDINCRCTYTVFQEGIS